jgi:hypothetical protein
LPVMPRTMWFMQGLESNSGPQKIRGLEPAFLKPSWHAQSKAGPLRGTVPRILLEMPDHVIEKPKQVLCKSRGSKPQGFGTPRTRSTEYENGEGL